MNELLTSDLSAIATEINDHHTQAIRQAKSALEHARQAGKLLWCAKSLVLHGQWLPWLEANCQVSARQAQRYMQVAANWEAITKYDTASYLTIDSALNSILEPSWKTLSRLLDEGDKPDQVNEVVEYLADLHAKQRRRCRALELRFTNSQDDLAALTQIAREAGELQREASACNLTLGRKVGSLLRQGCEFFRKLESEIGKPEAIKLIADAWGWPECDVADIWAVAAVDQ